MSGGKYKYVSVDPATWSLNLISIVVIGFSTLLLFRDHGLIVAMICPMSVYLGVQMGKRLTRAKDAVEERFARKMLRDWRDACDSAKRAPTPEKLWASPSEVAWQQGRDETVKHIEDAYADLQRVGDL